MVLQNFRRRRSVQTVLRFLADFFDNSSIHGLSHLARTNIHWLEFSFWLLTIVFMTAGAIYLSVDLIAQYKRENVVVTIDGNFMDWNSTKSSITVCSENVLDEEKIERYIREKKLNTQVSSKDMKYFLNQLSRMTISTIKPLRDLNYGISPNDYMELIFNLSRYDILQTQNLQFIRTVSDVGICYTHNNVLINDGVSSVHWGERSQYPTAQKSTPGLMHLNFFDKFPEQYFLLFGNAYLNTFIHSPYEMPTTWSRSLEAKNSKSLLLVSVVTTEVSYDTNLISDVTIEQRQCRTNHESNLSMFPKTYSRYLCLMECRAKFALRHCHCLPHFYGRLDFLKSGKMKICDVKGLNCLAKYNEELRNLQNVQEGAFKCSCLQNCNLLRVVPIFYAKRLNLVSIPSMKVVNVNIERKPTQQYRRSVIFTSLDFAVSIGNVLGVFLGSCVLTFVEIVYIFTLRLFWFRRGYRGAVGWNRRFSF